MKKKLPAQTPPQPARFPSIPRIFTDERLYLVIGILILLVGTADASYNLYKLLSLKHSMESQRLKISSDILLWQKALEKKPDYRDAYFQLAILEYQLGDKEKAKGYNAKAVTLDPNFEPGRHMEEILSK